MKRVELTDEQEAVAEQVMAFIRDGGMPDGRRWFGIQSLAGCGKSTLLAELAHRLDGQAELCALFGRAASNLSLKTGLDASTVHSILYRLEGELRDERGRRELVFESIRRDDSMRGRVLLLDESGTVPSDVGRDLMRTGALVIAAGDPGQLPPVKGERFFGAADATLHTVHRQAWDSGIIRQAHRIRSEGVYASDGAEFQVVTRVEREQILGAGILLCWKNATRRWLNSLKRAHLGLKEGVIVAGEPVMCLLNNRELGVLNGALYQLAEDYAPGRGMKVIPEGANGVVIKVRDTWIEGVDDAGREVGTGFGETPFAMGYAATVHKFIGSETDRVVLVDEYARSDWAREWKYTGATRAAKECLVYRA